VSSRFAQGPRNQLIPHDDPLASWRDANPKLEGNMRDHASIEQLSVLANIEGMNAEFMQRDRLKRLNAIAIRQMRTLTADSPARHLEASQTRKT
jgi:hypothetical protein